MEEHTNNQVSFGVNNSETSSFIKTLSTSQETMSEIKTKMIGEIESSKMNSTIEQESKKLNNKIKCFFDGKCEDQTKTTNPILFHHNRQSDILYSFNVASRLSAPLSDSSFNPLEV
jgi:hypothetical protein